MFYTSEEKNLLSSEKYTKLLICITNTAIITKKQSGKKCIYTNVPSKMSPATQIDFYGGVHFWRGWVRMCNHLLFIISLQIIGQFRINNQYLWLSVEINFD